MEAVKSEVLDHRKQMERVEAAARVASAAAKPRLLRLLAEPGFIEGLRGCCPELEAMTPSQRLDWFDAESAAAEMVRCCQHSARELEAHTLVVCERRCTTSGGAVATTRSRRR